MVLKQVKMVGCGWSGQHSMWTCKSRESQTEEDWVSGQAADVVVQTGEHWPFGLLSQ